MKYLPMLSLGLSVLTLLLSLIGVGGLWLPLLALGVSAVTLCSVLR